MKYWVMGKAVKKDGTSFPFRKVVDADDEAKAQAKAKRQLEAKKLYVSGVRLYEATPTSPPTKETPAIAPATEGPIQEIGCEHGNIGRSVYEHISEKGWDGFMDYWGALRNACMKIKEAPFRADQEKATKLCEAFESIRA